MRKVLAIIFFAFFALNVYSQDYIQKKNNLKITILSIFSGSLKITYERSVFLNQSFEITLGAIGPAFDIIKHSDPVGYLCRGAYKFIFPPKNQMPLEGWYIKPELAFSSYTYSNKEENKRLHVDRLAIMATGGYQWVRNWFVFDIFLGMGFGIGNANKSNYHHGYIGWNSKSIMAMTSGFKIGVAF